MAITVAITKMLTKFLLNKFTKLVIEAPKTFLILNSFIRDSAVYTAIPNKPRRDMDIETFCSSLKKQFLRLENALLAQYVKQQAFNPSLSSSLATRIQQNNF